MVASLLSLMVWMTIAYFVVRRRHQPVPVKLDVTDELVRKVLPTLQIRINQLSGSNVIQFPKGGRR